MADGLAADEMADFFGEVFGVVSGAFERLGHEDDLQAGLARNTFRILDVAKEDQVAEAVHFRIGADDFDGAAYVALREPIAGVSQHFLKDRRHPSEVAGVIRLDAAYAGQSAVGEAEQKITDAFQSDHELHAGEQFAGLGGFGTSNGDGNAAVNFHIERVEFLLADAEGIEQSGRSSGDALGCGSCGLFRHVASLDGAADEIFAGRLGHRVGGRGTHAGLREPTRLDSPSVAPIG